MVSSAIEPIRAALEGLSWMTVAYNRAFPGEKQLDGKKIRYPKVPTAGVEYIDASPNDTYTGSCFWRVRDPHRVLNWNPLLPNRYEVPADLIVYVNTEKAGIAGETAQQQVIDVLKDYPAFELEQINNEVPNVWADFNYAFDENELPYCTFRIQGVLTYKDSCDG